MHRRPTNTTVKRDAQPALAPQPTAFREHYSMPKVDDDFLAMRLEARVLDPKRRPDVSGRKTGLEISGMGGTPRKASAKHAFNKKNAYSNRPNQGFVPEERERTYEEEVDRIVDMQTFLSEARKPRPVMATSKTVLDSWERSIFG
jgi:hypothetical protein